MKKPRRDRVVLVTACFQHDISVGRESFYDECQTPNSTDRNLFSLKKPGAPLRYRIPDLAGILDLSLGVDVCNDETSLSQHRFPARLDALPHGLEDLEIEEKGNRHNQDI